jgi:hypothetical protein
VPDYRPDAALIVMQFEARCLPADFAADGGA